MIEFDKMFETSYDKTHDWKEVVIVVTNEFLWNKKVTVYECIKCGVRSPVEGSRWNCKKRIMMAALSDRASDRRALG